MLEAPLLALVAAAEFLKVNFLSAFCCHKKPFAGAVDEPLDFAKRSLLSLFNGVAESTGVYEPESAGERVGNEPSIRRVERVVAVAHAAIGVFFTKAKLGDVVVAVS